MKLGLGAVQFGMGYGISNSEGQTPSEEVAKILEVAHGRGIRMLDTAALYGASEEVLGHYLPRFSDFMLVTKTPQFNKPLIEARDVEVLEQTFKASLSKLGQPSVYGLLIHNADDLLAGNGRLLFESMANLREKGLVSKIGVSVYTAEQIDHILARFAIDLIQLPISVLDQRLIRSGHLARLKDRGVEVHVRSVFLQGLLLMEPDNLPPYFEQIRPHLKRYRQAISSHGLSPIKAALSFVTGLAEVDVALVGVNNHRQLLEILAQTEDVPQFDSFGEFAIDDVAIVNPANWKG